MLAILAMLAPKKALRVAPGGSAPPLPGAINMEQGIQAGTGKQASQPNWKAGWGDVTSRFAHSQKGTFSLCRMRGHFGCALTAELGGFGRVPSG